MPDLRDELEQALLHLPDIEIRPFKSSDLICLFYKGKEFAHFHGRHVLDLRLTPAIIRQEGLPRVLAETDHPDRSANSRWIEVAFQSKEDVANVVHLVKRACAETM